MEGLEPQVSDIQVSVMQSLVNWRILEVLAQESQGYRRYGRIPEISPNCLLICFHTLSPLRLKVLASRVYPALNGMYWYVMVW